MTFQDFLNYIGWKATTFWGVLIFLMSIGIEVIPKFKWNPWSALIKWIGSRFNDKIDKKMDKVRVEIQDLDKKVELVKEELSKHITESDQKALEETRRDILEFANSCMLEQLHTQEQFEFMIKKCDMYKKYIKENKIENGVIESAMSEIDRLYKKCRREHSFLVPKPHEGYED